MYTKKELKRAAGIIRQIAREHNVSEKQVRADMKEAMDVGRKNPDPAVQARWKDFQFAGEKPTVEEFILWTAEMVKKAVKRADMENETEAW